MQWNEFSPYRSEIEGTLSLLDPKLVSGFEADIADDYLLLRFKFKLVLKEVVECLRVDSQTILLKDALAFDEITDR